MPSTVNSLNPGCNLLRNVDFYTFNGPEGLLGNLASSANIFYSLMSAKSHSNVVLYRRNVFRHPSWGFMFWLGKNGQDAPPHLYGTHYYRWWHFIATEPAQIYEFVQWHRTGLAAPPTIVALAPSAAELASAMCNLQLVYPPDNSPGSSNNSSPVQTPPPVLPAPVTPIQEEEIISGEDLWAIGDALMDLDLQDVEEGFRQIDYAGWTEEELQRHRDAWGVEIEVPMLTEEEM